MPAQPAPLPASMPVVPFAASTLVNGPGAAGATPDAVDLTCEESNDSSVIYMGIVHGINDDDDNDERECEIVPAVISNEAVVGGPTLVNDGIDNDEAMELTVSGTHSPPPDTNVIKNENAELSASPLFSMVDVGMESIEEGGEGMEGMEGDGMDIDESLITHQSESELIASGENAMDSQLIVPENAEETPPIDPVVAEPFSFVDPGGDEYKGEDDEATEEDTAEPKSAVTPMTPSTIGSENGYDWDWQIPPRHEWCYPYEPEYDDEDGKWDYAILDKMDKETRQGRRALGRALAGGIDIYNSPVGNITSRFRYRRYRGRRGKIKKKEIEIQVYPSFFVSHRMDIGRRVLYRQRFYIEVYDGDTLLQRNFGAMDIGSTKVRPVPLLLSRFAVPFEGFTTIRFGLDASYYDTKNEENIHHENSFHDTTFMPRKYKGF